MHLRFRWLTCKQIEQSAQDFLNEHNPDGTLPVPIESIVERMGVDIVPICGLKRDFDLEGFTSCDRQTVYVDEHEPSNYENRYRFTLAHEVGHIVLHGYLFDEAEIDFDTVEEYLAFVAEFPDDLRGKFEWQAYEFAGRVLVPDDALRSVLDGVLPAVAQRVAQTMKETTNDESMVMRYAWSYMGRAVKQRFVVSQPVVEKRLEAIAFTIDEFRRSVLF